LKKKILRTANRLANKAPTRAAAQRLGLKKMVGELGTPAAKVTSATLALKKSKKKKNPSKLGN
jgi:hypothetical protein